MITAISKFIDDSNDDISKDYIDLFDTITISIYWSGYVLLHAPLTTILMTIVKNERPIASKIPLISIVKMIIQRNNTSMRVIAANYCIQRKNDKGRSSGKRWFG